MLPPSFHMGEFHKAAASSPHQNCVRVARRDGWTAVWDDKLAEPGAAADTVLSPTELLLLTDAEFDSYQADVRAGADREHALTVTGRTDGRYVFRAATPQPVDGVELVFDEGELDAFLDGVRNHEFDRS